MKFICISGKARAGKDAFGSLLYGSLTTKGKKCAIIHYADLLKFTCRMYLGWDGKKNEAGRALLQEVGTDIVRKQDKNFWVDFVANIAKFFGDQWDYIIVPDTRFPNEIERLEECGYEVCHIRIVRPGYESKLTDAQKEHTSEHAIEEAGLIPDVVITNSGTLKDLAMTALQVAEDQIKEDQEN